MPQLFNKIVGDTPEQQAKIDEIMRRGEEERRQIARENLLDNARIAGGALLSGASALPFFNIPYIGTGIGGAMEGAGQAIMQGKSGKDIAKDAGIGFAIGETVGAIPYAGKLAGKTKAGQAVVKKANGLYDKIMATDAAVNVAKTLDTDVKDFATPLYRRIKAAKAYGTNPFVKLEKARVYDLAGDNTPLTETQAFKNWFGNSKVVDESGKPLTLSHGSVKTFDTFDKDLASPESNLGAGFYFTNSASDVNANYYGGGPDFDNKVARLAERLAGEEDIAYDIAEERARKELMGDPSKIDAYLKMENPLYIGKNETQLFDYDTYRQKAIDQYGLNPNDFDDIDAFEDEVQASIDNILYDEPYELTNNLYDILDSNDVEKVQGLITDTYYNGGGSFENLKSRLNDLYLENPETGDLVGNEVARRIVENLGYDGIIDSTVSKKFNMNLNPDTTHYVVFNPTQIKSVNNQGTFDPTNPNIYKSVLGGLGLYELLRGKTQNEQ